MFTPHSVFTPFTQTQHFFAAWQKTMEKSLAEQLGRVEALDERYQAAEQQGYARAGEAIDAWAELMKAQVSYCQELSKAWRSQTLEMTKQVGKVASGA